MRVAPGRDLRELRSAHDDEPAPDLIDLSLQQQHGRALLVGDRLSRDDEILKEAGVSRKAIIQALRS